MGEQQGSKGAQQEGERFWLLGEPGLAAPYLLEPGARLVQRVVEQCEISSKRKQSGVLYKSNARGYMSSLLSATEPAGDRTPPLPSTSLIHSNVSLPGAVCTSYSTLRPV